jgi:hypothetical protein
VSCALAHIDTMLKSIFRICRQSSPIVVDKGILGWLTGYTLCRQVCLGLVDIGDIQCVFCIYLRTNSDLCHLQHKLIGFYNRDEVFTAQYELGLSKKWSAVHL